MISRCLPFLALISIGGCNQSDASPTSSLPLTSSQTSNEVTNSILEQPISFNQPDTDGDGIPDYLDKFPNDKEEFIDTNYNGVGDNQDGTDASTDGTLQDLQALSERIVSFQTGVGSLSIDSSSSSSVALQAKQLKNVITRRTELIEKNYVNYKMIFDEFGNITSAKSLTKATFGSFVSDLYYLALLSHTSTDPATKLDAEHKAIDLIKWLRWNGVSYEDISLVDSWQLSVFGQAIVLLKEQIHTYKEYDYIATLFWKGNMGRSGIDELIDFDYSSTNYRSVFYINADLFRSEIFYHFAGIFILPETSENEIRFKIGKWEQFSDYLYTALQPSSGLHAFLKSDGSAYHHYTNYMSGYVPQASYALTRLVYMLDGSPWGFSDNQLEYLSKYIKNYYFYSSLNSIPTGGRGRLGSLNMPASVTNMIYLLAEIMPNDKVLQQTAVNYEENGYRIAYYPTYRMSQRGFPGELKALETLKDKMSAGESKKVIEGTHYYPYSSMLATRQDNWLLTIKGIDRWNWSYEGGKSATNPQNLYGLYENYGSMQLHYFDESNPTSEIVTNPIDLNKAYIWSKIPGTTAPLRSTAEMLEDNVESRLRLKETSTGGVSLTDESGKTHGLYMLDLSGFLETGRDVNFKAKKTYFQLGEKVIAIGSSISNQSTLIQGKTRDYVIATTVFQTLNENTSPVFINSNVPTNNDTVVNSFTEGKPLLIVDSQNTGYFIPNDEGATFMRDTFSSSTPASPVENTTAKRDLLYINSGQSPQDASYEYVVLPNHNYAEVEQFAKSYTEGKEYTVESKDDYQHVVYDSSENIWAYALFSSDHYTPKGPLSSVSISEAKPNEEGEILKADESLVAMIEHGKDTMNVALSYPDLRLFDGYLPKLSPEGHNTFSAPVVLNVVVKGVWKLDEAMDGVKITNSGNRTQINIELVDGETRQVNLVK